MNIQKKAFLYQNVLSTFICKICNMCVSTNQEHSLFKSGSVYINRLDNRRILFFIFIFTHIHSRATHAASSTKI